MICRFEFNVGMRGVMGLLEMLQFCHGLHQGCDKAGNLNHMESLQHSLQIKLNE